MAASQKRWEMVKWMATELPEDKRVYPDHDTLKMADEQDEDVVEWMQTGLPEGKRVLEGVEPCTICQGRYLNESLPESSCKACPKKFHKFCISEWLKGHSTCPMCRSRFELE